MASLPLTRVESSVQHSTAGVRRRTPLAGLRTTFHGALTLVVTALVAIASFTSEANLLLLLAGIAAGLMAFNLLACARTVRYTEVDRALSGAAVAGRPFRVVYTVRNRRRWLRSWGLRIQEVPPKGHPTCRLGSAFIPMIEPGRELRVPLEARCPVRGRLQLHAIRITCGFPFGLFTCSAEIEAPAELVIYPAAGRVRREFWRQQTLADAHSSRRHEAGLDQDEFHGLREYRSGDNPRRIHWRRSARTGELVVREHEPRRDAQVLILLDPWPTSTEAPSTGRRVLPWKRGSHTDEELDFKAERIISSAATAVCEALDRGHRVGMIARGAVAAVVAPAGGRAHRQRLLNELALLNPGKGPTLDQLIHGTRWSGNSHARCLLFTVRAVEAHSRVLRLLSMRSQSAMLISPQSGWLDKLFDLSAIPADDREVTA